MQIEYRSSSGHRLEVNANGQILPGSGAANLRALGCPEYLAAKVENSRVLRRAAQAMAKGNTPAPAPLTDADRRKRANAIGQQIAADARKLQADTELKNRLQAAAGISHGRR